MYFRTNVRWSEVFLFVCVRIYEVNQDEFTFTHRIFSKDLKGSSPKKKKEKEKQKMGDMAGNLETVPYGSLERTAAFTRMH